MAIICVMYANIAECGIVYAFFRYLGARIDECVMSWVFWGVVSALVAECDILCIYVV